MNSARTTPEAYLRRLHELEEQFGALESELAESPEKRALSILHGMVHEVWRNLSANSSPLADRDLACDASSSGSGSPTNTSTSRRVPRPRRGSAG